MAGTLNGTATGDSIDYPLYSLISLAIYCFIISVFGIGGNVLVIYSSLRYDSIKLDKISLLFVRNLAVADVTYSCFVILPQFLTYLVRKWVLGKVFCVIMAQVGLIPISANTLTVLAITSYRLYMIRSPFSSMSTRRAWGIIATTWLIGCIPVAVFVGYKSKSEFHPENARCLSDIYDNPKAKIPVMTLVGLIVILPLIAITIFNVILSVIAIKHNRSKDKNYKALVMVCSLSGLFIISWTPYIVYTVLKSKSTSLPSALDLAAFHCIFLNSFGNPILYTLTNRRFSQYVQSVLLCKKKRRGEQYQLRSSSDQKRTASTNPE